MNQRVFFVFWTWTSWWNPGSHTYIRIKAVVCFFLMWWERHWSKKEKKDLLTSSYFHLYFQTRGVRHVIGCFNQTKKGQKIIVLPSYLSVIFKLTHNLYIPTCTTIALTLIFSKDIITPFTLFSKIWFVWHSFSFHSLQKGISILITISVF